MKAEMKDRKRDILDVEKSLDAWNNFGIDSHIDEEPTVIKQNDHTPYFEETSFDVFVRPVWRRPREG
jgi:hypothetical protein